MTTSIDNTLPDDSTSAHRTGVWAITLCVFALVASEFMPVSRLSPVSRDLGVSEGLAGHEERSRGFHRFPGFQ